MASIKSILMRRDGMSASEADSLIAGAREEMEEYMALGEYPDDICAEWFGLEPDYLMELLERR